MYASKYKYTGRVHILVVKLQLKFKLFVNYSICNARKIPKLVFHVLMVICSYCTVLELQKRPKLLSLFLNKHHVMKVYEGIQTLLHWHEDSLSSSWIEIPLPIWLDLQPVWILRRREKSLTYSSRESNKDSSPVYPIP
jgi:hypothetical protein